MAFFIMAQVSAAGSVSFQRYEVILDRKPFGVELPPPPPPAVPPIPPGESMVNQVRMSAVVRDDAGAIQVGLVDQKTKKPYFLAVGDSVDGIEIVEADYERERVRLRRGGEDYWVSMAGGSNRFEAVTSASPASAPPPVALASPMSLAIAGSVRQAVAQDKRLSYALRRQMREEARRRKEQEQESDAAKKETSKEVKAPVSPAKTDEPVAAEAELSEQEILRLLQQYQKELIRSGQQPLPIPLSPETDQELVNEGVLPPQAGQ